MYLKFEIKISEIFYAGWFCNNKLELHLYFLFIKRLFKAWIKFRNKIFLGVLLIAYLLKSNYE
jgi:hypothetical protein